MKFSVRMFRQMVLHVLYLEKENGNVPYHLQEKRVVPLVIVDKSYRNFRAFRSKQEKGNTSKGITFFPKTFHRDEPFHLSLPVIINFDQIKEKGGRNKEIYSEEGLDFSKRQLAKM